MACVYIFAAATAAIVTTKRTFGAKCRGLLWVGCFSFHPTNSVKALKGIEALTQSSKHSLASSFLDPSTESRVISCCSLCAGSPTVSELKVAVVSWIVNARRQLYHWCDMMTWSKYWKCVAPYSSLQFSDFFCSILSFWVTLLAVAKMNRQLRFVVFITGLFGLMLPVHMNRFGITTNLVPIIVGVCVVAISWVRVHTCTCVLGVNFYSVYLDVFLLKCC